MTAKSKNIQILDALDEYQATLAIGGDRKAFELLYKRWHPKLLRFAYRRTGEQEAALDVMQNAALTMAKDIHRLKEPSAFGAWAYTIVRRRAADQIQKNVRFKQLKTELARQPLPDRNNNAEHAFSVKHTLKSLPEAERKLLILFYIDGMRVAEIAAALGLPMGTVKSRLFAAREKLKSVYDVTGEGEAG